MPIYRLNNCIVHLKGTKLPKPCGEQIGIASDKRVCLDFTEYLCDGPGEKGGTCDRPLCPAHATEIGPNKHLCPKCHAAHMDNAARHRSLFTPLLVKG